MRKIRGMYAVRGSGHARHRTFFWTTMCNHILFYILTLVCTRRSWMFFFSFTWNANTLTLHTPVIAGQLRPCILSCGARVSLLCKQNRVRRSFTILYRAKKGTRPKIWKLIPVRSPAQLHGQRQGTDYCHSPRLKSADNVCQKSTRGLDVRMWILQCAGLWHSWRAHLHHIRVSAIIKPAERMLETHSSAYLPHELTPVVTDTACVPLNLCLSRSSTVHANKKQLY